MPDYRELRSTSDITDADSLDSERLLRGAADPAHVFPPVVYVPCAPAPDGEKQSPDELTIELRQTRDGRLALLVYSAMDRLIAHCGPAQPWTVLATQDLEKVRLSTGFELVLLDLDIPEGLRHTGEVI
jgi:hypothetical protein